MAILGPSGSGKSTMMNQLGLLDRPSSGRYWVDGVEVSKLNEDQLAELRSQKIGFVFQGFHLLARRSAFAWPWAPKRPTSNCSSGRTRVLLSVLGGSTGIALAVAAATFGTKLTSYPLSVDKASVLLAFGFSAAIGIFFGYYPAVKALQFDPIQALRSD